MIKLIPIFVLSLCIFTCSSLLIFEDVVDDGIESRNKTNQKMSYRLPTNTIPLSYTIVLKIDPNENKFQGQTTIQIKCISETNRVVLHTDNLNITNTTVNSLSQPIVIVNTSHTGDNRNFFTITLNDTLIENEEYELYFEYDGAYGNYFEGVFKNFYLTDNGTKRYLAVTQLQAIYARKVFPCYDEPALKAIFNIHIYVPKGYHAISNTEAIESTQPSIDNYKCTSFKSTPLMSTYLVAFVVSDFEYKSNTRDGENIYPKEFRVYATAHQAADYSLDIGQKILSYLQNYTGVDFRLLKVDSVAIPSFVDVGMENWGLVTYDESYLLNFKGVTTSYQKMKISTFLSHEFAHFWFGNEVTPSWWDSIWLSEGFATFYQFYATEKVYSGEWRLMEEFIVNGIHDVMLEDAIPNTKAMSAAASTPNQIAMKFSEISYNKSAAVVRMMQHVLGEGVFQNSISSYLKSLPTGITDQQKLFLEIQKVVESTNVLPDNLKIADVFSSWSEQPGYPIIYVYKLTENTLGVKQKRFYLYNTISSNERWWIPLTWATSDDPSFDNTTTQAWLSPNDTSFTITIESSTRWIIFNKQQCGYYRVMYSTEMWNDIINVLNSDEHQIIHPVNKAQLINDAVVFARTHRLFSDVILDLLKYLSKETDWIPWIPASLTLSYFNERMPASKKYILYKKFVLSLVKNIYESVGMTINEDDGYVMRRKRYLILKMACDYEIESCFEAAQEKLQKSLIPESEPLDPDLKSLIYCFGLRRASESLWNMTFTKYETVSSTSEKHLILNGLGCSLNDSILDAYLNMMISNSSSIRPQDRKTALLSLVNGGPFAVGRFIEFLHDNYLSLKINVGFGFIVDLGSKIVTDEHIEMFNKFIKKYDKDFKKNEMDDVLRANDKISLKMNWKKYKMNKIETWLEKNLITDYNEIKK